MTAIKFTRKTQEHNGVNGTLATHGTPQYTL